MLKKILVLVLIVSTQTIMAMQDYTIKLGRESYTVTQDFINQCKTLQVMAENTRKPESQNITEPTKLNLTRSMSQAQFLAIQPHVTALKNLPQPPNNIAIALSDESQTSLINLVDLAKAAYYLEVSLLLPVLSQELKKRLHDPQLRKFLWENPAFAQQFFKELGRYICRETAVTQTVRNSIMGLGIQLFKKLTSHQKSVAALALSKDGNYLFSSSYDNTICIWDVSNPHQASCINALTNHQDPVNNLALSKDGNYLFSSSYDNTICIWNVSNPHQASCINTLTHQDRVITFVLSKNGYYLFFTVRGEKSICIWNVSNPHQASCNKTVTNDQYYALVLSNDDNYLFSAREHHIAIWDVSNPYNASRIKTLTMSPHSYTAAAQLILSKDGNYLFATTGWSPIDIFDVSNPHEASCMKTFSNNAYSKESISAFAISKSGTYLFSGSTDQIDIFDISNPNQVFYITTLYYLGTGTMSHVAAFALSNSDNYLFSNEGKNIRIWKLPNFAAFERSMLLAHSYFLEETLEKKGCGIISLKSSSQAIKLAWYASMHADLKEMVKPHYFLPANPDKQESPL